MEAVVGSVAVVLCLASEPVTQILVRIVVVEATHAAATLDVEMSGTGIRKIHAGKQAPAKVVAVALAVVGTVAVKGIAGLVGACAVLEEGADSHTSGVKSLAQGYACKHVEAVQIRMSTGVVAHRGTGDRCPGGEGHVLHFLCCGHRCLHAARSHKICTLQGQHQARKIALGNALGAVDGAIFRRQQVEVNTSSIANIIYSKDLIKTCSLNYC